MPHIYNTRANLKFSILKKNLSTRDTSSHSILTQNDSHTEGMSAEASHEQLEATGQSVLSQGGNATETSRTTKKTRKSKKSTTEKLVGTVERLTDRVEALDRRIELQEQRSVRLSVSNIPSAHSSPKSTRKRKPPSTRSVPSPQDLRSDSVIQEEVASRMHRYKDASRLDDSGTCNTKPVKSGRYRVADHRVKCLVRWPHEDVNLNEDLEMPAYKEMEPFQWCQGMVMNIFHEKRASVRDHMLLNFAQLLRDSQELSFPTAKRAHAEILSEIERGHITWQDEAAVDRVRQRFTQRTLKTSSRKASKPTQLRTCKRWNEGNCKEEDEHVSTDGKVTYKHSCSYCYKETKINHPHQARHCQRAKRDAQKDKQQV